MKKLLELRQQKAAFKTQMRSMLEKAGMYCEQEVRAAQRTDWMYEASHE